MYLPVISRRVHSQGYSLIEVLIGILILSVGILGMASMQVSAKRVGYDSLQRSIATTLAHDMIERIRSNPNAASNYIAANLGGGTATEPNPNCFTADCDTLQLAAHDLWEWEQALKGASEQIGAKSVGGLVNPRGCITHAGGVVTVTVAWKGFQSSTTPPTIPCGLGLGLYGPGDEERQLVYYTTIILR